MKREGKHKSKRAKQKWKLKSPFYVILIVGVILAAGFVYMNPQDFLVSSDSESKEADFEVGIVVLKTVIKGDGFLFRPLKITHGEEV